MKSKEDTVVGLEHFPETLNKLFAGGNFGKLVLQVAAP
jgi:NADPH-dependent curcumin reductase CurA